MFTPIALFIPNGVLGLVNESNRFTNSLKLGFSFNVSLSSFSTSFNLWRYGIFWYILVKSSVERLGI